MRCSAEAITAFDVSSELDVDIETSIPNSTSDMFTYGSIHMDVNVPWRVNVTYQYCLNVPMRRKFSVFKVGTLNPNTDAMMRASYWLRVTIYVRMDYEAVMLCSVISLTHQGQFELGQLAPIAPPKDTGMSRSQNEERWWEENIRFGKINRGK